LVCSTATFWDTCVLCALTGLTFVCAMMSSSMQLPADELEFVFSVFSCIPFWGQAIVLVSIVLLGISSIIGWNYIGSECFSYLFRNKKELYNVLWIVSVFVGAVAPIRAVWYLTDLFTAAMMIPNLYSVIVLRKQCRDAMYLFRKKTKIHRIFTHI